MSYYANTRSVTPFNSGSGKEDFLADWFAGYEKKKGKKGASSSHNWQAPDGDKMPVPASTLPNRENTAPDATAGVLDGQIRQFQQDQGLKVDGIIYPNGETANRINQLEARQMRDSGENPAGPMMHDVETGVARIFGSEDVPDNALNRAGADTWRYAMAAYKAAKLFGQKEVDQMRGVLTGNPHDPQGVAIDRIMRQAAALAKDKDNMRRPDDTVIHEALVTGMLYRLDDRDGDARQQQGVDAKSMLTRALSLDDQPWAPPATAAEASSPPPAQQVGKDNAWMDQVFADHNAALQTDLP